jgi:hypothetical protein
MNNIMSSCHAHYFKQILITIQAGRKETSLFRKHGERFPRIFPSKHILHYHRLCVQKQTSSIVANAEQIIPNSFENLATVPERCVYIFDKLDIYIASPPAQHLEVSIFDAETVIKPNIK